MAPKFKLDVARDSTGKPITLTVERHFLPNDFRSFQ